MFGLIKFSIKKAMSVFTSLLVFYQGLFHKAFDYFFPNYDPEKAQEKLKFAKLLGWEFLKKSVIHMFVLFHCYLTGLVFFMVTYYFMIPKMYQEGPLNFSKHKSHGYLSTFINNGNTNLCQYSFEKTIIEFEENFNLTRKQICQANYKHNEETIALYREYYTIKINLQLPETEINYYRGSFSINSYIINNQGEIIKIPKIASMLLDKRKFILFGLWDKMMIFLGLKDNIKSMEVVIENLPNHLMEIQAILINIPDNELILFDSTIQIETKLFGIRYYLYYWFWTSLLLAVNAIALSFFLVCFILINLIPLIPTAKGYVITYIKSKNLSNLN